MVLYSWVVVAAACGVASEESATAAGGRKREARERPSVESQALGRVKAGAEEVVKVLGRTGRGRSRVARGGGIDDEDGADRRMVVGNRRP